MTSVSWRCRFAERVLQTNDLTYQMAYRIGSFHGVAVRTRKASVWIRYPITIVLVLLTGWAWQTFFSAAGDYPFLIFFPVIFACAALFDRGNGFVAAILSAIYAEYFILQPTHSLAVSRASDVFALVLFLAIGLLGAAALEALHAKIEESAKEHDRSQQLAQDRQVLIEELAHRTRNDLANIATLLNIEARSAIPEAREVLQTASDRVQAVARVHRHLELRREIVVVDSKLYISELCDGLRLSRLASRSVSLDSVAESHPLGIEKAVPLGLIVNEAVTNAAKHAFPDDRPGKISVRFERSGDVYHLTIRDNGCGRTNAASEGTGSRLILMLAAQLGGTVDTQSSPVGTVVILKIPVKAAKIIARQ